MQQFYNQESKIQQHLQNVQAAQFKPLKEDKSVVGEEEIDLITEVSLPVIMELGRVNKQIQDVIEFEPGTIIELNKTASEPVDILVNKKYVGKGEVVVIEESLCVKITEIN